MADEIKVTMTLTATKGGTTMELMDLGTLVFNMSGSHMFHHRQLIGSSPEAINMGSDVTVPGWFIAVNRNATNEIKIQPATGVAEMIRMNAGEACCFRLEEDATAPFASAPSGDCDLEYVLIEA